MIQPVQISVDPSQRVFALVNAMSGMAEGMVDRAVEALLRGDGAVAQAVLQKETLMNRMEMHIDAAVLEHLAHRNIPAKEIRSMAWVLKINKDLERMGDLAANIARKVIELGQSWEQDHRVELQPMAIAVSHVCRKALRAVSRRDLVLAQSALDSEEAVHTYRNYVGRRIRERLRSRASQPKSDLALLVASRSLEQMAGHAARLAANVLLWIPAKAEHALLAG